MGRVQKLARNESERVLWRSGWASLLAAVKPRAGARDVERAGMAGTGMGVTKGDLNGAGQAVSTCREPPWQG